MRRRDRLLLTDDRSDAGGEWTWDAQLGGNPRLGTQMYPAVLPATAAGSSNRLRCTR